MTRGEIWTVAGGAAYAGKPRPAVIIQHDAFDASKSIVVCPLTTNPTKAAAFRIPVKPSEDNGLSVASHVMLDKISAVPRARLRQRVGVLDAAELRRVSQSLIVFLDLIPSLTAR